MALAIIVLTVFSLYMWGSAALTKPVCEFVQRRTHSFISYAIWSLIGCLAVQAVMVLISVAVVQLLVAFIFEDLPKLNGIDLKKWIGILETIFLFGTVFWAASLLRYWRLRDRESD